MQTQQLKKELLDMVEQTNDVTILSQVKSYLGGLIAGDNWWDEITEVEAKLIKRGKEDIKAGRVHSNEFVKEKISSLIANAKK